MDLKTTLIQQAWPGLRPKLQAFHARAGQAGYRLLIVRVWASLDDQMRIYQVGRTLDRATGEWTVTDPALIRTKAQPGASGHNVVTIGLAQPASMCCDLIPLDKHDAPLWPKDLIEQQAPWRLEQRWVETFGVAEDVAWSRLYELAHKCGLDPLGDAVGAYLAFDKGHFEEPGYTVPGFLDAVGCRYLMPAPVGV